MAVLYFTSPRPMHEASWLALAKNTSAPSKKRWRANVKRELIEEQRQGHECANFAACAQGVLLSVTIVIEQCQCQLRARSEMGSGTVPSGMTASAHRYRRLFSRLACPARCGIIADWQMDQGIA